MISRIDHLNIVVSNLEEASAFFRLLGFVEGMLGVQYALGE